MPEGHTLHRLARDLSGLFRGDVVRATSPQGRFADGAHRIDGRRVVRADAHGKHLFVTFDADDVLHVHLGLYGTFSLETHHDGADPVVTAPKGQVRLRLEGARGFADLRGATRCELLTPRERRDVVARLGPDPLRRGADGGAVHDRLVRSSRPVAALLMQQDVVAGIGNVYRAELLFRHGIDPYLPGRRLTRARWDAMWDDLRGLMRVGVRRGRIDTTRPEHTPRAMRRPPRQDRHGGDVYVYRRAGEACYVCGAEIRVAELDARNLFWCPGCQPAGRA